MKTIYCYAIVSMAVCTVAFTGSSPNKHAPIGVMADHMHHHGEFMFSYRYMHMLMEDNESSAGTMLMDMHMIGMMYAPTDNITLMLMTNYLNNDMEMNMGNINMSQSSQGLGDMSVTGLFQFKTAERLNVHANAGITIPMGNIDLESEQTHSMSDADCMMYDSKMACNMASDCEWTMNMCMAEEAGSLHLPYSMQLGSGTFDPILGITAVYQNNQLTIGGQAMGIFRFLDNSEGYHLGHKLSSNMWFGYNLSNSVGMNAKYTIESIGTISGSDPNIDEDISNSGRVSHILGLGINLLKLDGIFSGHRIALEYNIPIVQDYNGTQMEIVNNIMIGWQYTR